MCDESYEDAIYVLFDFPRAKNVWRDSHLLSRLNFPMQNNNATLEGRIVCVWQKQQTILIYTAPKIGLVFGSLRYL